jgi:aliphatic nitrilase
VTTVRAAAVQLRPVLYSHEQTVAAVIRKVDELAEAGGAVRDLPETVIPCYPYFAFVQRPYEMNARTFGCYTRRSAHEQR